MRQRRRRFKPLPEPNSRPFCDLREPQKFIALPSAAFPGHEERMAAHAARIAADEERMAADLERMGDTEC